MRKIMEFAVHVSALLVVAYIVPGFTFDNIVAAVIAAIVIGIINTFLKPILQLITLPITILTLGISAFLLNVLLLYAASFVVPGFDIASFGVAVIASIALTLVSWFLHRLTSE